MERAVNKRSSSEDLFAYIQGSVDESPSGLRLRSLERPGAKTPRPWPRIAQHQGSLIVNLEKDVLEPCVQLKDRLRHTSA